MGARATRLVRFWLCAALAMAGGAVPASCPVRATSKECAKSPFLLQVASSRGTSQGSTSAREDNGFFDTNRTKGPVDVSMNASVFIAELEPCARELFDRSMPRMEDPGVPGIDAVFVVHGTQLHDRLERLKTILPAHGIHKWTVLDALDGPMLSPDNVSCLFGDQRHSDLRGGPNHQSSVAKPHLAYYAMVKAGLQSALVIEDDIYFPYGEQDLGALLPRLAMKMPACDVVQIAPYAIGYLISNGGARKMLSALKAGQEKVRNPADWQMDYIESKVTNFIRCSQGPLFDGDGHGSNHA